MQNNKIEIPVIAVDENFCSVFKTSSLSLSDFNGMFISERQQSLNFRHRMSKPGYKSDWHVAGDPTLIIIRQGKLELTLRNQQSKTFSTGDQFIAADYLPANIQFSSKHGHRAQVLGQEQFLALHIKLSANPVKWHKDQVFI